MRNKWLDLSKPTKVVKLIILPITLGAYENYIYFYKKWVSISFTFTGSDPIAIINY